MIFYIYSADCGLESAERLEYNRISRVPDESGKKQRKDHYHEKTVFRFAHGLYDRRAPSPMLRYPRWGGNQCAASGQDRV